ncbi:MAG: hypothetical protein R3C11_26495 [Planctomycetaceae bacterium]
MIRQPEFYGFLARWTIGQVAEHTQGTEVDHPSNLVRTRAQGDGESVSQFISSFMLTT